MFSKSMDSQAKTFLTILVAIAAPSLAAANDNAGQPVLECSLATYILIGITVVYSLLSLVCLILIIVNCCCCKRRRNQVGHKDTKNTYENELAVLDDDVFFHESEVGVNTKAETTATVSFKNKHTSNTATEPAPSSNSSLSSSSSSSSSDNDTRQTIQNPSLAKSKHDQKYTSPHEKKGPLRARQLTGQLSDGSPLVYHNPKASPIPPTQVPVPFSNNEKPTEPFTYEEVDQMDLVNQSQSSHGPTRSLPPIQKKGGTPREKRKLASFAIASKGHMESHSSSSPTQQATRDSTGYNRQKKKDLNLSSKDSNPSSKECLPFSRRKVPRREVAANSEKHSPLIKNLVMKTKHHHHGDIKVLTESVLKTEMTKISHKWQKLGQAFSVSSYTLFNIQSIHDLDNERCMMCVCEEWMRMNISQHYWKDVVAILESDEIGEKELAQDIYRRYCTNGGPQVDGKSSLVNENDAEGLRTWIF